MSRKPTHRATMAVEPDDAIRAFFRREALNWLADPNVTGVMLGRKAVAGEATDREAIVFRVARKLADRPEVLAIGSKPIPAEIEIAGRVYPTDVIEGAHRAGSGAGVASAVDPRQRFPFICAGVSISNAAIPGDVGTGTAVVRHRATGQLALLSCDHVLGRRDGNADAIQPGRADNGGPGDRFGTLVGQMRDLDGDAAIATISKRPAELRVAGLDVVIDRVAMPRQGDLVVKAGRTSGISRGKVAAAVGTMLVDYRDSAAIELTGFEIEPIDGNFPQGGDSGAPWLLVDAQTGRTTGTLLGIHTSKTPDGSRAFACFAKTAFDRLQIEPVAPGALPVAGFQSIDAAPGGEATPMRVIARRGLSLRSGAGVSFPRLGLLPFQAVLTRLGTSGDWTKVDLQNDGAVDGFVYSEFLEAV